MNESCLFESCVTGAFVSDGLTGLSQRVDEEQNGPHVVAVDQVNERVGCHVGGRDGRRIASGLDRSKFFIRNFFTRIEGIYRHETTSLELTSMQISMTLTDARPGGELANE